MARKALGRGISAIIPDVPLVFDKKRGRLVDIDLQKISENPSQPRGDFDHQALEELSRSIGERGVLQPVVVRSVDDGFQLIIGERRVRAAKLAGVKRVPAIILEVADETEMLELALVENLQREDLNPIDEARAYQKLIAECGLTQKEVSQKVGKDRTSVANALRLLKLPDKVQAQVMKGNLTAGHARALLALHRPQEQIALAERIVRGDMSVRAVERLVKKEKRPGLRIKLEHKQRPAEFVELEEKLQRILGTAVRIFKGNKKGRLEIEFYSDEDLERILGVLGLPISDRVL
jgi:ParB family chromosome partitioning protein